MNFMSDFATFWDPSLLDLFFWPIKLEVVTFPQSLLQCCSEDQMKEYIWKCSCYYEFLFQPKFCGGLSLTTLLAPLQPKGAFGLCPFLIKNSFQI